MGEEMATIGLKFRKTMERDGVVELILDMMCCRVAFPERHAERVTAMLSDLAERMGFPPPTEKDSCVWPDGWCVGSDHGVLVSSMSEEVDVSASSGSDVLTIWDGGVALSGLDAALGSKGATARFGRMLNKELDKMSREGLGPIGGVVGLSRKSMAEAMSTVEARALGEGMRVNGQAAKGKAGRL